MLPYQQIRINDQYRNPFLYPGGNIYIVLEKDDDEKMVKVQAVCSKNYKHIGRPLWLKHTDRMFSESWRVEERCWGMTEKELESLCRELVATLKKAHEYIGDINSFYGQGLQVYGWHFNGEPVPFDNFIDSNGGCEAEEFVGRVLTKAKKVLGE